MGEFVVGINHPWFADKYGSDMGYNQFSGSQLWHWPHSDDISDIDFSIPEDRPPRPFLSGNKNLLTEFFQYVDGIDVIRIWLFERMEGLIFDHNKNVDGIDREFVKNLKMLLDEAKEHSIRMYLCLFDSWVVKYDPPSTLPENRLPQYKTWQNTVKEVMKTIVQTPFYFINNALKPLVEEIGEHETIFGIDLMNEPEGMLENMMINESDLIDYVTMCSHPLKPTFKVSIGWMRMENARRFSNLPIDFCDAHVYNESGYLPPWNKSECNGKDCIIGECGYPVSATLELRNKMELDAAKNFVLNSSRSGYSGCLVWNKDFTDEDNNRALLDWMKEFRNQRSMQF